MIVRLSRWIWVLVQKFGLTFSHIFAFSSSQVWTILAAGRPDVALDFLDYPEHIFLHSARYVLGGKMLTRFLVKAVIHGISSEQYAQVLGIPPEDSKRFGWNRITNKEWPGTPIGRPFLGPKSLITELSSIILVALWISFSSSFGSTQSDLRFESYTHFSERM